MEYTVSSVELECGVYKVWSVTWGVYPHPLRLEKSRGTYENVTYIFGGGQKCKLHFRRSFLKM